MKVLFIGGTGTISSAVVKHAQELGMEVTLLNRGKHSQLETDAEQLTADCRDEESVQAALGSRTFDAIANFIVYKPLQAEQDIRLFSGRTQQYVFISSASAYQKPAANYKITESTPLSNPYWQYSRDKIACEQLFLAAYRNTGFPVTIVRPSHTYGKNSIPVAIHGDYGSWQVLKRMQEEKPIIVHGDGLSWWTFTHNTDFAKGFCGLLGNPHAIGEAVHITSDETLTWNAAYQIIGQALGVTPHLVHIPSDFLAAFRPELLGSLLGDKANSVVFDNTKIKTLVPGFCASTRFDQGVRQSLEHILQTPACQVADPNFDQWCDEVITRYFSAMKPQSV